MRTCSQCFWINSSLSWPREGHSNRKCFTVSLQCKLSADSRHAWHKSESTLLILSRYPLSGICPHLTWVIRLDWSIVRLWVHFLNEWNGKFSSISSILRLLSETSHMLSHFVFSYPFLCVHYRCCSYAVFSSWSVWVHFEICSVLFLPIDGLLSGFGYPDSECWFPQDALDCWEYLFHVNPIHLKMRRRFAMRLACFLGGLFLVWATTLYNGWVGGSVSSLVMALCADLRRASLIGKIPACASAKSVGVVWSVPVIASVAILWVFCS